MNLATRITAAHNLSRDIQVRFLVYSASTKLHRHGTHSLAKNIRNFTNFVGMSTCIKFYYILCFEWALITRGIYNYNIYLFFISFSFSLFDSYSSCFSFICGYTLCWHRKCRLDDYYYCRKKEEICLNLQAESIILPILNGCKTAAVELDTKHWTW